jgi:predicted NUDIX family NTP pyrophosphohydrolase
VELSAGILLYKRSGDALVVFLVHPGGPFWKNKDAGAWSVPKGEPAAGEDLLAAAKREFVEETGQPVGGGEALALTPIRQSGGKRVHAWAIEGDADAEAIVSNLCEVEWPPRSGRRISIPEVDRAAWFSLDEARTRINKAQVALLDELAAKLA